MNKRYQVKVSPRGQITLPKEICQKACFTKGNSTIYISMISSSHIEIEPKSSLSDFYGSLQPDNSNPSALNVVEEISSKEIIRASKILS